MPPIATWSQEAQFSPDAACVAQARTFASHHLDNHQLPYLIDDIKLVVSELVTNAVVHAKTDLTVVIREVPHYVRVAVQDQSSLFPILRTVQEVDTGGRGLQIVSQCATEWGTMTDAEGNKTVWALFATLRTP